MFWYWFAILLIVSSLFIGVGVYMIYSAFSGKGIPHPGEDAMLQTKIQYRLRGLIGVGMLIAGLLLLYGIVNGIR